MRVKKNEDINEVISGVKDSRVRELLKTASKTRYRGVFINAFLKKSRASAIKAKCIDCCAFEDILKNVGQCRATTCPLHKYRPYQKGEK
jgi:hypothetical protein